MILAELANQADWPIVALKLLFAPLTPFIMHPGRVALVAFAFFVAAVIVFAAKRRVSGWLFTAAVSWALFAWWEHYCTVQKYDIRVDLMLIAPILYAITIAGLVLPFLRKRAKTE